MKTAQPLITIMDYTEATPCDNARARFLIPPRFILLK
jgi:hypothetical protein